MLKAICQSCLIKMALVFSVLRLDMAMSAIANFPTSAKMLRVCGIISLFIATLMAVEVRAGMRYEIICSDSGQIPWSRAYTPTKYRTTMIQSGIRLPKKATPKDYVEALINAKLADGWKLQGGVSVFGYVFPADVFNKQKLHFEYCQALVKETS